MPSGWQSGQHVQGTQEMVLVAMNTFSPLSSPGLPFPCLSTRASVVTGFPESAQA